MNKFTIGTGYYESSPYSRKLFEHCLKLIHDQSIAPYDLITLSCGGASPPFYFGQSVELAGNLGHVENLLGVREPKKDYAWCGWSVTILSLALLAYQNETDFIFVEQDVLLFGTVFERMYEEIGDAPVIYGTCAVQPAANSLFMVRHAYIPQFVQLYLSLGTDSAKTNLPEMKFDRLGKKYGWKTFRFGYDRDRPAKLEDLKAGPCYIQQVTPDELARLKEFGMV